MHCFDYLCKFSTWKLYNFLQKVIFHAVTLIIYDIESIL